MSQWIVTPDKFLTDEESKKLRITVGVSFFIIDCDPHHISISFVDNNIHYNVTFLHQTIVYLRYLWLNTIVYLWILKSILI